MFDTLIHQVLEALAVGLAGLLVALITKTLQRLNLRLSAENQANLDYQVQQAIQYAEEKVEALVKAQTAPLADKATKKLNAAIVYLLNKIPGLDSTKAQELILTGLGASPFGASKSQ